MLRVILPPLLALFGGLGGFFLRRWELTAAFDADGLAIPWAPASLILILLSVLLALAFILLSRRPRIRLTGYPDAFCARNNWVYAAAGAISAAMLGFAGVFGLKQELTGGTPRLLQLLLWVLCIASFFCVVRVVWFNLRAVSRRYSLELLIPAYTSCIWLVAAYQVRAAEPVVLSFIYELLAIICTALALYFSAGFSFAKGSFWRCAVFSLLSVYFSIVTLADGHSLCMRLLFLFAALYHLATVFVLFHHAFIPAPKRLEPEMNNTQEVTPDE